MKHLALTVALVCISHSASAGSVTQPEGWYAQYHDGSCVVHTEAAGASPTDPDWKIKLGYLSGSRLFFLFSAKTSSLPPDLKIPAETKAWLTVDGKNFAALSVTLIDGETIVPAENSLALQKALATAKQIGARIQTPSHTSPVDIMDFNLSNIPGAVKWLNACAMVGKGALPD